LGRKEAAMSDPNGINYPQEKELRLLLAEELRKLQESDPARSATVAASEHWPEYAASVVQRLQAESDAAGEDE
jgi:hypothetical protein